MAVTGLRQGLMFFSNVAAVHYQLLGGNSLNPKFPSVLHVQILKHVYASSHGASQVIIQVQRIMMESQLIFYIFLSHLCLSNTQPY